MRDGLEFAGRREGDQGFEALVGQGTRAGVDGIGEGAPEQKEAARPLLGRQRGLGRGLLERDLLRARGDGRLLPGTPLGGGVLLSANPSACSSVIALRAGSTASAG